MMSRLDWLRQRLVNDSFSEARSLTSAFLLVWFFRQGIVDQRHIVSKSMHPTLAVGDRVLVDKASITFGKLLTHQNNKDLRRNDIVVFKPPEHSRYLFAQLLGENPSRISLRERMLPWKRRRSGQNTRSPLNLAVDFTKRVVAVAGDEVAVHRGLLYVNKILAQPFPRIDTFSRSSSSHGKMSKVSANRHHKGSKASYSWGPTVVPTGHVFVLGDCRDESFDSHMWGPLPVQNVIGRARVRCWPIHRLAWFRRDPPPSS